MRHEIVYIIGWRVFKLIWIKSIDDLKSFQMITRKRVVVKVGWIKFINIV